MKEDFFLNSGNPALDAKIRLNMSFKDIVLQALYAFKQNTDEIKHIREYLNQGGGATFEDIIKAIEDDSPQGLGYLELLRQITVAELESRGVYSPQTDKKIIWE